MPSPNIQVSILSIKPVFSSFNFISRSRNLSQFRASIPINRLYSISLPSSPSSSQLSAHENSSDEHSFEVSYLINTFGWPPKLAISKAKNLKLKTTEKPERVLAFVKRHKFTQTQISLVVERYPTLLLCHPEKTLLPKFGFLSSLGLSTTEITDVVTKAPKILKMSLEKRIIPAFDLFRSLVNSDDEAVKMIKRYPTILTHYHEADNTQILLNAGVPAANIVLFMGQQHEHFTPPTPDKFRKMVEEIKEMGFDPCTKKFLYALRAIKLSGKSTWEVKVQVLKKYGWSDRDIVLALEKDPRFIKTSKDKMEKIMDYLVNRMGFEATEVSNCPYIFCRSLEKIIIPRCLVYQSLLEKGLCKRKLCYVICISEAKFLTRFIQPYGDEVPDLWDLYNHKSQNGV